MSGRHVVPAVALLGLLAPRLAWAEAQPAGAEFQINTYTDGAQRRPAVACFSTNDFVAAWDGADTGNGTVSTVFAQRRNAAGDELGDLFEAPSQVCVGQNCDPRPSFDADVCRFGNGGFVVAWERGYGADGSGSAVFAERFDSAGSPLDAEFQVNAYTIGYQYGPAVACRNDGSFVVVWQQEDAGDTGVFGRRFDGSGGALGTEFRADSSPGYYRSFPDVALAGDGGFVVVWASGGYFVTPDGSGLAVVGRRFGSGGAAQGGEFVINAYTEGYQQRPAVVAAPSGGFVVVWESGDYYATQDGSYAGVFGRRFDGSGGALGTEFQVNGFTSEYQQHAAIAAGGLGGFVVAWQSGDYYGTHDGSYAGVFAQRFDGAAGRLGTEFQVNSYTAGDQAYPAVCADDLGSFLVVWDSQDQDGAEAGLFARRYAVADVGGHARYYVGDRPVPGADVRLSGGASQTTATNAIGGFSFATLPQDTISLRATKAGDLNGAVSSLDAAHTQQARVGLRTFDALQILACDVTGNGTITSLDAALIQQFRVGLLARLPVAETCDTDFLLIPDPAAAANQSVVAPSITATTCTLGTISYSPLAPPAADQDLTAVLFGDCTGNWQP